MTNRLSDLTTDTLIEALRNTRWGMRSSRSLISRRTFDGLEAKARTIETILEQRGLSAASVKAIR